MKKTNVKEVHLSIDDVLPSLRYIVRNHPKSIFDLDLYSELRRFHDLYDAKFTLYCMAMMDDFLISEVPDSYIDDFKNNSYWLRFGYHSKSASPFLAEKGYKAGYDLVNETLKRLGTGRDDVIRVHSWYASKEQKLFFKDKGIKCLLYPDDDCLKYNDDDYFYDVGILHRRCKVWLEKLNCINYENLHIGDKFISLFTHEWCFLDNRSKLDHAIKIYVDNGYEFI